MDIVAVERNALAVSLRRVIRPLQVTGPLVIADVGHGPLRTANNLNFIVECLRRLLSANSPLLEYQIFLNVDKTLPAHDLLSLHDFLEPKFAETAGNFTAAVPGTMFARLFPTSSVNVFYSVQSLHWLSKIPDAVLDKDSPAYNRGKSWVTNGALRSTGLEYTKQASSDFRNFLNARAAETVPGGLLFLSLMMGRSAAEPNQCMEKDRRSVFEAMVSFLENICWIDLISKGLLTEEHHNNFNIPIYARHIDEVMEDIKSCESAFDLVGSEQVTLEKDFAGEFDKEGPGRLSFTLIGFCKTLLNSILEENIGKHTAKGYWESFQYTIEQKEAAALVLANPVLEDLCHIVSLVRK